MFAQGEVKGRPLCQLAAKEWREVLSELFLMTAKKAQRK
jgi:hypothetical protein